MKTVSAFILSLLVFSTLQMSLLSSGGRIAGKVKRGRSLVGFSLKALRNLEASDLDVAPQSEQAQEGDSEPEQGQGAATTDFSGLIVSSKLTFRNSVIKEILRSRMPNRPPMLLLTMMVKSILLHFS